MVRVSSLVYPFMLHKSIRLPDLPEDALELIWFWVRVSLRPRMKRHGPLLINIRGKAGARIAEKYGVWLFMAYRHIYSHHVITPNMSVEYAWRMFGLPNMCFTVSNTIEGSDHTMTIMRIREDEQHEQIFIPLYIERRCKKLWSRIPQPQIVKCETCNFCNVMVLGPPLDE